MSALNPPADCEQNFHSLLHSHPKLTLRRTTTALQYQLMTVTHNHPSFFFFPWPFFNVSPSNNTNEKIPHHLFKANSYQSGCYTICASLSILFHRLSPYRILKVLYLDTSNHSRFRIRGTLPFCVHTSRISVFFHTCLFLPLMGL